MDQTNNYHQIWNIFDGAVITSQRFITKRPILSINRSLQFLKLQQNNMPAKKAQKLAAKSSKKGIYNKYPFETRRILISMVEDQNRTLASAAKELGICQTTARLILSTWKSEGRVFQKKSEREKRMKRQAKRRANEKRKEKLLRQRQVKEQSEERVEAPNVTTPLKAEKMEQQNPNELIQNLNCYPHIAENPEHSTQLMFQPSMPCQLIQNGILYYFQPLIFMPTQTGPL